MFFQVIHLSHVGTTNRAFMLCCFVFFAQLGGTASIAADPASEQFTQLLDEIWENNMRESPLWATAVGDHRYNDRLPSVSVADSDRRNAQTKVFLQKLETIDRNQLTGSEQTSRDILHRQLSDRLAEHRFHTHWIPISGRSGFHINFPELRREVPLRTTKDYENYLARLRSFAEYTGGHIELMRQGIATGQVLPAVILIGWEKAIDAHIVDDPKKSLLYEPFEEFPNTVSAAEHERLRAAARDAIAESVVQGYRTFRTFMENEYVPQARGSIGASALPGGREFYRHRVRRYTTLDRTPEEVHQIGLVEVARIRTEMAKIIEKVEFDGDFSAFVKFLREDPQFYAKTEEQLLREVSFVLKKMDGQLPRLFKHLPRMSYGVRSVPEYIAPRTTAAYYQRPAGDGSRAGFFYMNTYDLKSRPLFTVEALSLHEAVPGHHLQIALQQEIKDLPRFRRYGGFTAYIEGWALYAESLGREVGLYEDPYSDFGRLTMEIWRACRLVVDTGIHYFGWTRERAINYLSENSAMSQHNIRAEIDRYIGWPGQALAYKTGEMKIRELRNLAEEKLGEQFDVREFHDVVLRSGAVPLDVLEANVRAWLKAVSKTSNAR